MPAYHGGSFFKAIGEDFKTIEKKDTIISADVLDAWFEPSPKIIEKLTENLSFFIKTSPPTHCEGLIETISKNRGIPIENIAVGGGSSNLMFCYFPNLISPKSSIMILDPMYGEYKHIFNHVIDVNLSLFSLKREEDFEVNTAHLLAEILVQKPAILVMVNPNSPTGKYIPKNEMIDLIHQIPKSTTIIIDETYIEYLNKAFSLEYLVVNNPNLIIIKSMSKVYALSGVRVAYIMAHKNIIQKLNQFIPPWSVSLPAQVAAIEALNDEAYYLPKYQQTHVLRNKMIADLNEISNIKIYNSVANFFMIELLSEINADLICEALAIQNIFIRNCDSMSNQFENKFIRIAVKTEIENEKIISALKKLL